MKTELSRRSFLRSATAIDTCGIIRIEGEKFQKVYRSKDPAVRALMANYQAWRESKDPKKGPLGPPERSSTLFDTVAVYLAYSQRLCHMEKLGIRVTDDGFTRLDDNARRVNCAMKWKSLDAFEDELVDRLLRTG